MKTPAKPRGKPRTGFTLLPVTPRGVFFFLLASALLGEGLARKELGALVCGAGILAAELLSLAGILAEGRKQAIALAADPEALEVRIGKPRESGNGFLCCSVSVRNLAVPAPRAPGIAAVVAVRLEAENGRLALASIPLPARDSDAGCALPEASSMLRGLYRGYASLEARDVFGFFRFSQAAARGLETVVLPNPYPRLLLSLRGEGGERTAPSDRLVRGDDRFDSRPYAPGDDPRRIHWKQYARFGDLFVRPGDLMPPPREDLTIFVDTQRPPFLAGAPGDSVLDNLAAAAAGLDAFLRTQGRRGVCSSWGIPDAPDDEEGRRRWFSALAWGTVGGGQADTRPGPLVIFGAPGGTWRKKAVAERGARGFRTILVIPRLSPPKPLTWKALFIRDPESAGISVPTPGFRRAYGEALERDAGEAAGPGGADVRVL